jgi:hypothetical protein
MVPGKDLGGRWDLDSIMTLLMHVRLCASLNFLYLVIIEDRIAEKKHVSRTRVADVEVWCRLTNGRRRSVGAVGKVVC